MFYLSSPRENNATTSQSDVLTRIISKVKLTLMITIIKELGLMHKATRMTRQKKIILDILRSTTSHPTADWIYSQAKEVVPNISLGTVYRNLSVLKQMGEIMELNYGSTYSRFDGNPESHYHFVCEDCGKVFDVEFPVQVEIEKRVEELAGHRVFQHRMEFYGNCINCLTKSGSK